MQQDTCFCNLQLTEQCHALCLLHPQELENETAATILILASVAIGLVWAVAQFLLLDQVKLVSSGEETGLMTGA